jgi:hypothetical protein
MGRGKGMTGIAARLGVSRQAARKLVARGALPVTVEHGVHIVAARDIRRYLADAEALPAWENEGGACRPHIER